MPDGQDQAQAAAADDQQQQDDSQSQAGGDAFDRERAMATIAKLRDFEKTAKAQAKELEALRAKAKEQDDAKLSEQEKLQQRIKELEAQQQEGDRRLRAMTAETALVSAATKAGAMYPDLLAGQLAGRIEFDAAGQPSNADALVADAKKSYPAVFRAASGSADGGAGNGQRDKARGGQDMNQLIRTYAGRPS